MVLFTQIYIWFSIIITPLNLLAGVLNLNVKFKAFYNEIIALDVLWAVCTLACIIISFIY